MPDTSRRAYREYLDYLAATKAKEIPTYLEWVTRILSSKEG